MRQGHIFLSSCTQQLDPGRPFEFKPAELFRRTPSTRPTRVILPNGKSENLARICLYLAITGIDLAVAFWLASIRQYMCKSVGLFYYVRQSLTAHCYYAKFSKPRSAIPLVTTQF